MSTAKQQVVANAMAPRGITSSTDATPIVVTTDAAHGLSTGDKVTINGHTTNIAANGTWTITKTLAAAFSLDDSVGSGAGAGAGGELANPIPSIILVENYSTVVLTFDTDGGGDADMTVLVRGSYQEDAPDFAKAQSVTNQFDNLDVIDLQDNASIDGDTGFAVASADDHVQYEVNVSGIRWLTVIAVANAGGAGEVTVTANVYNPNSF